ncbi:MAG: hypothetical protein HQ507_04470, partial [Candidatus Marinimicrobia bacterium]|nr:hypothetical protein [Candidatus Neomarinimicrobiota bacterium]
MKTTKVVLLLLVFMTFALAELHNGSFEGAAPNYFSPGGTSTTAEVIWGNTEYRTGGRSLEITKANTDGTASWVSEDL